MENEDLNAQADAADADGIEDDSEPPLSPQPTPKCAPRQPAICFPPLPPFTIFSAHFLKREAAHR